ncbi:uncharacterized protein LOC118411646 [Branchiostoma floridae]|uniref:Uncharacterized protein LOC118411646 n=1 Tax=Branchiostoma floridae TaxID=7739 RepID=C3Z0W0_BRAFL|nr:uncharacterized protein LOC118411646 [Branchiostoma floridae]|eukprot:XP_002597852.1 hypothetical protein BRAFLDRAFT_131122 [Branchiostoma floridae]
MAFVIRKQKAMYQGSRCCVPKCSNRQGTDKLQGVRRSYYRFPQGEANRDLRRLWETSVRRDNWTASKHDRVCSDHFAGGIRTHIKGSPGYIPSIFAWTKASKSRPSRTSEQAGTVTPVSWCKDSWSPAPETPGGLTERKIALAKQREEKQAAQAKENTTRVWKEHGHDYPETCRAKPSVYDEELAALHETVQRLEEENSQLKNKVFSLDTIKDSDKDFQVRTNLPNFDVFSSICEYLKTVSNGRLKYWRGQETDIDSERSRTGRERTLTFEEEFFLVLVKLKSGDFNQEIASKFGISESQVSKIFTTWINFLHRELRYLFEMKTSWENEETIPECYRRYPHLISVIDCTELQIEMATTLQARKETYSNYKNRDTVKFMVGLSPNLTVNYVSKGHGGRASDKHITLTSEEFINQLPPNSVIMADKGFNISKELSDKGVRLVIPDFKGRNRSQMSAQEAANSESISSARIHIERIIQRIRTFHILGSTLKISQQDITEQIFSVCAYMTNFQMPIINLRQGQSSSTSGSNMTEESIFDFI